MVYTSSLYFLYGCLKRVPILLWVSLRRHTTRCAMFWTFKILSHPSINPIFDRWPILTGMAATSFNSEISPHVGCTQLPPRPIACRDCTRKWDGPDVTPFQPLLVLWHYYGSMYWSKLFASILWVSYLAHDTQITVRCMHRTDYITSFNYAWDWIVQFKWTITNKSNRWHVGRGSFIYE